MSAGLDEHKIVVVGSGGVGKSALTIRLVTNQFRDDYDPTIEDVYQKQLIVDDRTASLDITDTAGQEGFTMLQDQWMRAGEGFLLVYSISNQTSFDDLSLLRDKILRACDDEKIPLTVVGNKCDLPDDEREVTKAAGEALAAEWGCPFLECSAKTQINSTECFHALVQQCRKHKEANGGGGAGGGAGGAAAAPVKKKGGCAIL